MASTCPPWASAITRAASGLARPSTSNRLAPRATSSAAFSRRVTAPTCSPKRATVRESARRAWWYCTAKRAASSTSSNNRKNPSERSISRPRWRTRSSRARRSCVAHVSAARASPTRSTKRVLSTTSVNNKARSITALSLRRRCHRTRQHSGPLSVRRNSDAPCTLTMRASTAIMRPERIEPATFDGQVLSLGNSSTAARHLIGWLVAVVSNTKPQAHMKVGAGRLRRQQPTDRNRAAWHPHEMQQPASGCVAAHAAALPSPSGAAPRRRVDSGRSARRTRYTRRTSAGACSGRVAAADRAKWNSVSDGTIVMPSPARTMPATVLSWSSSIIVCSCIGYSAASTYWRTLLERARCTIGCGARSFS